MIHVACPRNRYGSGCRSYCCCYGRGHCDPVYDNCTCDTGYTGAHCWTSEGEGAREEGREGAGRGAKEMKAIIITF